MNNKSVFDCSVIDLGKINFAEGNLTVVENNSAFPFDVKRVFYLYDIAGGESRGAHAHKECHQFLIAAGGSFEVSLNDGTYQRQVFLNRPNIGLHIPPGVWASEINFSSGAICLVVASHKYNESDYIRNYDEYLSFLGNPLLKLVKYDSVFLEKSWDWLNDPEVKYLTNTGNFSKEEQEKWFQNLPNLINYKIWGITYKEEPIGVFGIKNIQNGQGEYWGYIGEKKHWGAGLGSQIIELIVDEGMKLELIELNLKVIPQNLRAIKLYEKKGFVLNNEESDDTMLIMKKKL